MANQNSTPDQNTARSQPIKNVAAHQTIEEPKTATPTTAIREKKNVAARRAPGIALVAAPSSPAPSTPATGARVACTLGEGGGVNPAPLHETVTVWFATSEPQPSHSTTLQMAVGDMSAG